MILSLNRVHILVSTSRKLRHVPVLHFHSRIPHDPPSSSNSLPPKLQLFLRASYTTSSQDASGEHKHIDYAYGTRDTRYTRCQFSLCDDVQPKLLAAIERRDFRRVASLWEDLLHHGVPAIVFPKYWRRWSAAIDTVKDEIPESLDQTTIDSLDSLAIYAAASGYPLAICARLHWYLSQGSPDTVIRLFVAYCRIHLHRDILFQDQNMLSPAEYQWVQRFGKRTRISPAVVCHVLVAFATKNSFSGVLKLFGHPSLASAISFDYDILRTHLPSVTDDSILWRKALQYGDRWHLRKSLAKKQDVFEYYITKLLQPHKMYTLHPELQLLLRELAHPQSSFIAFHPSAVSSIRPVLMDQHSDKWASLVRAAIRAGRHDFEEALLKALAKIFSTLPDKVVAARLHGYANVKTFGEVRAIWTAVRADTPDGLPAAEIYHAYLAALLAEGRIDDAMSVAEEFRQSVAQGLHSPHDPATVAVFNVVLNHLVANAGGNEAWGLLQDIQDIGVKPDVASYNIFLRHFTATGQADRLQATFGLLTASSSAPDAESYSWLFMGLRTVDNDAVGRLLAQMAHDGIEPSANALIPIVRFLTRPPRTDIALDAALDILRYLDPHLEGPLRPTGGIILTIQCAIERRVWANKALEDAVRKEVSAVAQRHGREASAEGSTHTCHSLIRACLDNPTPEATARAWLTYRKYAQRFILRPSLGVTPIWIALLDGLRTRACWELVDELLLELDKWQETMEFRKSLVECMRLARARNSDPIFANEVEGEDEFTSE